MQTIHSYLGIYYALYYYVMYIAFLRMWGLKGSKNKGMIDQLKGSEIKSSRDNLAHDQFFNILLTDKGEGVGRCFKKGFYYG